MDDDARVLAQFPGELAATDIDRVHQRGAVRQQHVGKAAGRGADIERRRAGDLDREMVERESQLDAAARYPGMIAAGNGQLGILGNAVPGLSMRLPAADTRPAMISACAFARLSARPRSTSS